MCEPTHITRPSIRWPLTPLPVTHSCSSALPGSNKYPALAMWELPALCWCLKLMCMHNTQPYIYIYTYIYIGLCIIHVYMYIKSSFPKRIKEMSFHCQCQVQRLYFGKELFTYVRIYVHIYEELFSKTWSPNLALALQHRFLDWRHLEKSSLYSIPEWIPTCDSTHDICKHMYILVYI